MGQSWGMFAVIVLLLGTMLVVGIIVAMIILLRGKRKKVREPQCGACGYAVAGLDALRCPECGADLREVGIATPQNSSSPFLRAFALVTLWSLAMGAVLIGVSITIRIVFPLQVQATTVVQLTPVRSDADAFRFAQITYSGQRPIGGGGLNRGFDRALIQIQNDGGLTPGFEVDVTTSPYRGRQAGQANWGSFDGRGMQAWGDAELSQVAPPRRTQFVGALQTQVTNFMNSGSTMTFGREFSSVTSSSSQLVIPNSAQQFGTIGCIAVWFAGLIWIVVRALRGPGRAAAGA